MYRPPTFMASFKTQLPLSLSTSHRLHKVLVSPPPFSFGNEKEQGERLQRGVAMKVWKGVWCSSCKCNKQWWQRHALSKIRTQGVPILNPCLPSAALFLPIVLFHFYFS